MNLKLYDRLIMLLDENNLLDSCKASLSLIDKDSDNYISMMLNREKAIKAIMKIIKDYPDIVRIFDDWINSL